MVVRRLCSFLLTPSPPPAPPDTLHSSSHCAGTESTASCLNSGVKLRRCWPMRHLPSLIMHGRCPQNQGKPSHDTSPLAHQQPYNQVSHKSEVEPGGARRGFCRMRVKIRGDEMLQAHPEY